MGRGASHPGLACPATAGSRWRPRAPNGTSAAICQRTTRAPLGRRLPAHGLGLFTHPIYIPPGKSQELFSLFRPLLHLHRHPPSTILVCLSSPLHPRPATPPTTPAPDRPPGGRPPRRLDGLQAARSVWTAVASAPLLPRLHPPFPFAWHTWLPAHYPARLTN
jgi:hypothetical protein